MAVVEPLPSPPPDPLSDPPAHLAVVADAFSRAAPRYDALAIDNPHMSRMRAKVLAHVERAVPPGARILELNAGTGIDAAELARRGYRVHATDIAPGMLRRARARAADPALEGRMTVGMASFTDLAGIAGAPYDAVFSNFGGLNCAADLRSVAAGLRDVLRPDGVVVWVVMPPVCLWELAEALRGDLRTATRRLRRGRATAHLEGRRFRVRYHTPDGVARAFGRRFEVRAIEGISVVTPTANSRNLALRRPRLYRAFARVDDRVSRWPILRASGDFFAISLVRVR